MLTAFVIDGFNFYHSIKKLPHKFRWFNYFNYCAHFLRSDDIIGSINYCTALAEWVPETANRHKIFIEACKLYGINIIMGKFKKKTSCCPQCKTHILHHEEKETDVNIALTAYRLAAKYEQIILVSGDSDLVPAIKAIKVDYPNVKIGVIFPFNRVTRELKQEADFYHKTKLSVLDKFIMPYILEKPGGTKIACPEYWRQTK